VERSSIKLDLHRRDFTINTLALRLDGHHYGELHDYWGGLDDLHSGLVRVLHSLSFVDDPTRILRAVRFEQRFDFRIEERTMQLLREARPLIDRLSGDRIRHELNHIFNADISSRTGGAAQILARLHELDLLAAIHPYLTWDEWLHERIGAMMQSRPGAEWGLSQAEAADSLRVELGYTLWLVRLTEKQATQVIGRLKLPAHLAKMILTSCELWTDRHTLCNLPPSAVVARLEDVQPLARYTLYLAAYDDPEVQEIIHNYLTRWQQVAPIIDGHGLRALGLPPGPQYRKILGNLRNAWLDGEISTAEDEMAFLEKLLQRPEQRGVRNSG
jgi:tRNA nucleotidyltransferase (CCA-adding enzyme)